MSDDDRPNDEADDQAAPAEETSIDEPPIDAQTGEDEVPWADAPAPTDPVPPVVPPPPGAPAPVDAPAGDLAAMLRALDKKIDTLAGATAAVVSTQTDLLDRNAESEARRGGDALDVAQRLDALERQVLALSTAGAGSADRGSLEPLDASVAELTASAAQQREDLALALDVLARMAESLERSDARTEDRLAAVRDAAAIPVADLQALLTARADRTDAQLNELAAALEGSAPAPDASEGGAQADGNARIHAMADRVTERVDELAEAVRSLSWQLPEIAQEVSALRERVEGADVSGAVSAAAEDLALHTDTALAGMVRLVDERLTSLLTTLSESSGGSAGGNGGANQAGMGFEAGAVMGAAQAAWNRLEQRIDTEFDDLGRQLHSMAALIERALTTAEAAANRPVVTGDQLRSAASTVKETVLKASRSRRDRRGGPRSLGPGPS